MQALAHYRIIQQLKISLLHDSKLKTSMCSISNQTL